MKPKLSIYDIERIQKAASLLRDNITQDWTILELSNAVRLTDKKLKAGFKQEYSVGPHTYLRNIRIEKVKEMLIKEVSTRIILTKSGFKSESGLSKTFKKVVGVTPTEFKNNPSLWEASIREIFDGKRS
jgi:AraC family transcriptional regulator